MRSAKLLLGPLIVMLLCLVPVHAQDAQSQARISNEVTIIIQSRQARFTLKSAVEELRLQVFNQSGETVFDSGPNLGAEIVWPFENGFGETIKSGLYAYTLSIKEFGNSEARVRRGHFIVDRAADRDGSDRLWVTSQSGDGVGAELTVARGENGAVAGTASAGERTVERQGEGANREVETESKNSVEPNKASAIAAGTVGTIAKFTSATEVGDSVIAEQGGNIGIGVAAPKHRLSIAGGPAWTSNFWSGAMELQNGAALAWQANGAGQRAGLGHSGGGMFFFRTASDPGATGSPANYDLMISDAGAVGIGTTAPQAALEVVGNWDGGRTTLRLSGQKPSIQFADTNGASGRQLWLLHLGSNGNGNLEFFNGSSGIPTIAMQPRTGNVGIGTSNPVTRLHVDGTGFVEATIRSFNERAILALSNRIGPSYYTWTVESGVRGIPTQFGIFNRTVGRSGLEIDGSLQVTVRSLRLDGGADFAENFEVNDAPETGEVKAPKIEAGMVVSIDPANPGKLRLSSRAYDRRVVGVISGAGGVKPGMVMGQEGTIADGKHPVALSGRVWVYCDATRRPIVPGDLLTTSRTRGHAMKVTNPAKAQGAIIGKAMTGLKSGKGLVLTLVTLQ